MQSWTRVVRAESKEDAEMEGLTQLLESILPDTIDEWHVRVKQLYLNTQTGQHVYDVTIEYHKVGKEEE